MNNITIKYSLCFIGIMLNFLTVHSQITELKPDGLVVPRLHASERDGIINPQNGRLIYNLDQDCFEVFQDHQWASLCGYDLSQPSGAWKQLADIGEDRHGAVGFAIGSKGYMGLGSQGFRNLVKDFWEYDPTTDSWTQKADFGGSIRDGAVGFAINNKGYVGTGDLVRSELKDFWAYDPASNTWSQIADFAGSARYGAVAFTIEGKGYVGTGSYGSSDYSDFWKYDPILNSWNQIADFAGGTTYNMSGFGLGSKGYVGTGYKVIENADIPLNEFWEYDPATDSWQKKSDFPGGAREGATGFAIGNKGYLGFGMGDTEGQKDIWEYDPGTDIWIRKTDLPGEGRSFAIGFGIGSKGYFGTGISQDYKQDFYEFSPLATELTNAPNTFAQLNSNGSWQLSGNSSVGFTAGATSWQVQTMANKSNANVDLRQITGGGIPYIDFSNDPNSDFDGRIILVNDDLLHIDGVDLNVNGSIQSNGTTLTSDLRFKTQLHPIHMSLDKIHQIQGSYYDWLTGQFPEKHFADERQIGFIAQDIEEVFPELVSTDAQGFKSVDYARFTPILTEALKEQLLEIQNTKQNVDQLENQCDRLTDEIQSIDLLSISKANDQLRVDLLRLQQKLDQLKKEYQTIKFSKQK